MSATYRLPAELEKRLAEEAERSGLIAEECLHRVLDRHLPPPNRVGISDFTSEGVRYQLVRLSDEQLREYRHRAIPIQTDDMPLILYFDDLEARGDLLQLGQAYAALKDLFGESGNDYDDWKGSFCFPFLLTLRRSAGTFRYLLRVNDFRGWIEYSFYRIADHDLTMDERSVYREPFPDEFSSEEINRFIVRFYGYLASHFREAIAGRYHPPFLKEVPSNLILSGCSQGRFFEREYPSQEEYDKAREAYRQAIQREVAEAR